MRRWLVAVSSAALVAIVAPAAVVAHTGEGGSRLDRQAFRFRENPASTSSTAWRNVRGLSGISICAVNEVSVDVSLVLDGAPVAIRVVVDGVPEARFHPGVLRVDPAEQRVVSWTWADHVGPFEENDLHRVDVQWRSLGGTVTLARGLVNLLYEEGTRGPACD